jgi:hypothetical protein
MNRNFIRKHINSLSIVIFVVCFVVLQWLKPHFLYNSDGSLRQFGLGFKKKTIIPIWLVSIILAILSYLFVLHYLAVPKIY